MSQPENPLSQYYTYAYHHVLLACDTTAVAEALQNANAFTTFLRTEEQVNTPDNPFGKYTPRDFEGKGNYSIIINGMVDAEFVIKSATWDSVTAASAGGNGVDRFTTMAVEGSMVVEEPRGIKFMNVMANVADFLQSDPSGIIFILKTIFVGYAAPGVAFEDPTRPDSGQVYDPITNIRPFLFIMYDITGDFKVTGGTYKIAFVGLNNGASKQKHIMRATDRVQLNLNEVVGYDENSKTLAGALKRLQSEIGEIYEAYYQSVKDKVEKDGLVFSGRKVEYIIDAETPYIEVIGKDGNGVPQTRPNSEYVVTDFKQQNTDSGEKDEAGIISLSTSPSVESAIMRIVNRCPKVKRDMVYTDSQVSGEKIRWIPKVVSTINSTREKFQVVYKLRRVMEGRADVIEKILQRDPNDKNNNDADVTANTLELDYFFTGKNTDIINFDLKMEMGLAFFQTLVSTETLPTQPETVENKTPGQSNSDNNSIPSVQQVPQDQAKNQPNQPLKVRQRTPIYFSTKFDDKTTKNSIDPKLSSDFQALLNRHAALESLEAKVTIHGNPGLLNATNKPPSEVIKHVEKTETDADPTTDLFPYWESTPAIVKLNIKMPSDGEDRDFAEPFWYEGFYYCWAITHKFDSGEFTQDLNMISLPQSNTKANQSQSSKASSEQAQQTDNQRTAEGTDTTQTTTTPTSAEAAANPQPAENSTAESYLKAFVGGQSAALEAAE